MEDLCQRRRVACQGRCRGGLDSVEQGTIALAAERGDDVLVGGCALLLERGEQPRCRRRDRAETVDLGAESIQHHVEVARRTEVPAEPGELLPQRGGPVELDERAGRSQERAQAPRRDAQLMEILGIVAAPGAGVVGQQGTVFPGERGSQRGGGGRALRGRHQAGHLRQVESAMELRLQLGRRGSSRLAELLHERPQLALVAVEQLDLDLTEASCHALPLEHGNAVVDDFGATSPDSVPPRAETGGGNEGGSSEVREQQSDQLFRRPAGSPLHLQFEPSRPARQLQLPPADAVLDPVPERDAMARQPQVSRVVVRRDEDARGQPLATELREDEALVRNELDLALQRLLHAAQAYSWPAARLLPVRLGWAPMKISLTPKTTEFFVLFASAGDNALEVARLVETRFREHPNSGVTQSEVKAVETSGDVITRDLITLLNTQYLTPFDREDIYQLATRIDDVVDYLEEASDLLGLYGVEMPTRHAVEQCSIIVQAVKQLATACENLKGMRGVQQALVDLKSLEDQGDRVLRDALASLFRDDQIDPLIVIRWKDIYEALERSLDACETAGNVIANILVKNA